MADTPITLFRTVGVRVGTSPSNPSNVETVTFPPQNPPGSSSDHAPVTIATPANGLTLNGQELGIGLASSGVTGALSGTDWDTFNGKIGGAIGSGQVAFGTGAGSIGGDSGLVWYNSTKRLQINRNLQDANIEFEV